jgi:hypothetical protein
MVERHRVRAVKEKIAFAKNFNAERKEAIALEHINVTATLARLREVELQRVQAHRTVLDLYVTDALRAEIVNDGEYKAEECTIFQLFDILARISRVSATTLSEADLYTRKRNFQLMKQTVPLPAYTAEILQKVDQLKNLGCPIATDERELIDIYIHGLDVGEFRKLHERIITKDFVLKDTLREVIVQVTEFYHVMKDHLGKASYSKFAPSIIADHTAYATDVKLASRKDKKAPPRETARDTSTKQAKAETAKPTEDHWCEVCLLEENKRMRHRTLDCYRLAQEAVLTKIGTRAKEKVAALPNSREKKVKVDAVAKSVIFNTDDVAGVIDAARAEHADGIRVAEDSKASVSIVNTMDLFVPGSVETICGSLTGAVPNATLSLSNCKGGQLLYDLGYAILVEEAKEILISEANMRKTHYVAHVDDNSKVWVHRTSGAALVFRSDAAEFGDTGWYSYLQPHVHSVMATSFYRPKPRPPVPDDKRIKVQAAIDRAQEVHSIMGHAGLNTMRNLVKTRGAEAVGCSVEDINIFDKYKGCEPCVAANERAYSQSDTSTKPLAESGLQGHAGADVFYVESQYRSKMPVLLVVCYLTGMYFAHFFVEAAMRATSNRVEVTIQEMAVAIANLSQWSKEARYPIKLLRTDNQVAFSHISMGSYCKQHGIDIVYTAKGQHVGRVEAAVGHVKGWATAIYAESIRRFAPIPKRFIPGMVADVIKMHNLLPSPKDGSDKSPRELFFLEPKRVLDMERDLRASYGELILCHCNSGIATGVTDMRAQWGMVVGRALDGTGVLHVLILDTMAVRAILQFTRKVTPPDYILAKAREIAATSSPVIDTDDPFLSLREDGSLIFETLAKDAIATPIGDEVQAPVDTAVNTRQLTETVLSAQMSHNKGVKLYPKEAEAAMAAEVLAMLKAEAFVPIKSAPAAMTLDSLDAFKIKIKPNAEIEKYKSRIFMNGSKQVDQYTAESSSPVARIESVFTTAALAAYHGWIVFKVDVVGAYLNTPRPEEVKYKYARIRKAIAALFVEQKPEYAPFLQKDGSLLVEINRMVYGMRESGYYWYKLFTGMLAENGFTINPVDPCVWHYFDDATNDEAHVANTVDDGLWCVKTPAMKDRILRMYTARFGSEGFTVETGDRLNHLGMELYFNRDKGAVEITQVKGAQDLTSSVRLEGRRHSHTAVPFDLYERKDSTLLSPAAADNYRSVNAKLGYLSTTTYPECRLGPGKLASYYGDATEDDQKKLERCVDYVASNMEHKLILRPASTNIVASADASFDAEGTGFSRSGWAVGFKGAEGIQDSFVMFGCAKQTIVALSSTEAELVAACSAAQSIVWFAQLLEGYGIRGSSIPLLYQDNTSAIHLEETGQGNFKNSKHIRRRFFYVHDLISTGELMVRWQSTVDMVADLLTKPVTREIFEKLLPRLLGQY